MLQANIPVISLRIANVCAPRLSIGPLPIFYNRLIEEKACYYTNAIRDFLDISDFLALLDLVLQSGIKKGVFNVSSGTGNSIKEVFASIAKHIGVNSPKVSELDVGEDDVKEVVLDPSTTQKTFGWKRKVSFEEIIKRQCYWFETNSTGKIFSHLKRPNL